MEQRIENGDPSPRANELYWSSDASVNKIADELDLSKGSLYALIQPLGSGLSCPSCGTEMEYPNRTARDKHFLTCADCGLEEEEAVVRSAPPATGVALGTPEDRTALLHSASTEGPDQATVQRIMLGTALLGAAAGIALALWARRK